MQPLPTNASPCLLGPAYADEYRALMLQAYAQHPEAFTSSASERATLALAWWQARLQGTERANDAPELVWGVFAARPDGQRTLAGVAGLRFAPREKERHKCTLFGMYVAPPQRGQGMADRLVASALQHARSRPGLRLVQLTVSQGNHAALALYTRHGFVPYGLEPLAVAVHDGFVAKHHLWCDLHAPTACGSPV